MTLPEDNIKLRVRPISQLRPHEETVERISENLSRSMARDGYQRDPVVVDEDTGTILDGTHRVEALKKVGARAALTYLVDYKGPGVGLFRWYRVVRYITEESSAGIIAMLKLQSLGALDAAGSAPESNLRVLVAYQGQGFGRKTTGLDEEVAAMRVFDMAAASKGLRVEFIDEASATPEQLGGGDLFFIPPRFGKDDVLRAGALGKLFPPKSTLHVFPYRPLGVRYPVEALRTGRDVLDEMLKSKRPRLIESSASQGGRRYREKAVVYE